MERARVVYLSWPAQEISGGIKMAYRHVEALCAAGFDAVVATQDGNAPAWFATTANTIGINAVQREYDTLVFPENHGGLLKAFHAWPNRKVVFCQNPYMVFRGLNGARCYSDYGVSHIISVGRHTSDYCRRRFPALDIAWVPVFVDNQVFRLGSQKHLQIAYSPRKRPLEAEFIKDLFSTENPQWNVRWVPIAGIGEPEVARILAESAIYLSLCRFEACPLSILEAFCAGCITAGFTGFGARDYTTTANGFWAAEDDCLDVVMQLGRAMRIVTDGKASYSDMLSTAYADAQRYSRQAFETRLVRFWESCLQS